MKVEGGLRARGIFQQENIRTPATFIAMQAMWENIASWYSPYPQFLLESFTEKCNHNDVSTRVGTLQSKCFAKCLPRRPFASLR